MLASHMGASLNSSCSACSPAPCQCTQESMKWLKSFISCTHLGDLVECLLSVQLQSVSALAVRAIWGVRQQTEDSPSVIYLLLYP